MRTFPNHAPKVLAALALAFVLGASMLLLDPRGSRTEGAFAAPGVAGEVAVPAEGLVREAYVVVPAVLGSVYEAFALAEEEAIYDRLATVAAGDALEALYLERAGALATGGLPDQVVHELKLQRWSGVPMGDRATIEATWHVLGEVGHAEHTHMRGNAYSAVLTLEPVDDAWRLTGFELTDVDRTDAGELTTLPDGDAPAEPDETASASGAAVTPEPR